MSDISALTLNQTILQSALGSVSTSTAPVSAINTSATTSSSEGGNVYAVEGDSLYKEEMDSNSDGVVTNQELASYYAKLAADYGDSLPSGSSGSVSNVVTTSQAANTYASNEFIYSAPYTSLIEVSA